MKVIRAITLDPEVLAECKMKKLNVSNLCNTFLRTYVGLPEHTINSNLTSLQQDIERKAIELANLRDSLNKAQEKKKADPNDGIQWMEGEGPRKR